MMFAELTDTCSPGGLGESAATLPDAGSIAALEFLERSREVASERVVDSSRPQKSPPSQREEIAAPVSGLPV
jgi:hypothetical protein